MPFSEYTVELEITFKIGKTKLERTGFEAQANDQPATFD